MDDALSTWALTMVMVACAWLWAGYLVFSVTPKHTCVAFTGLQATAFILNHFILNFSFTEKRDGSEAALAAPKRVAEDHLNRQVFLPSHPRHTLILEDFPMEPDVEERTVSATGC